MARAKEILPGQKFEGLTVIREIPRTCLKKRRFLCLCDCGNEKEINLNHLSKKEIKSCGCRHLNRLRASIREKSPTWKGGRRIVEGGYVEIYMPEHPNARTNGYIKEHRFVMEQKLNRKLYKEEIVHHINGQKDDNRLENLELWNISHPSGQRIEDKIKWAKQILEMYHDFNPNTHTVHRASS